MNKLLHWLPCLLLLLAGCRTDTAPEHGAKLRITATTGMAADAARQIAGSLAEVEALMGPGTDPHLYKATPGDLSRLRSADAVVYNGLHLEGKLIEALEQIGRSKPVIAMGAGLAPGQLRRTGDGADAYDPHIWFDVQRWKQAVLYLSEELAARFPEHAAAFRSNASAYAAQLDSLDAEVRAAMAAIPQERRVLITAHDAFGYFGEAYGVEVRGLQGISTVAEFGLRDVSELASFIVERNIGAVFVESSIPPRNLEAVIAGCRERGHEVRIGGTLYSDAMGPAGSGADTYIGMVRSNAARIAEGLR
ncbi:MAG: zinc ABC transporter substrate-binding protein [Bacteroidia bacterium]|nr:zinc ABC transporter substrate-binding protein [Bacteroidia bacterium]